MIPEKVCHLSTFGSLHEKASTVVQQSPVNECPSPARAHTHTHTHTHTHRSSTLLLGGSLLNINKRTKDQQTFKKSLQNKREIPPIYFPHVLRKPTKKSGKNRDTREHKREKKMSIIGKLQGNSMHIV